MKFSRKIAIVSDDFYFFFIAYDDSDGTNVSRVMCQYLKHRLYKHNIATKDEKITWTVETLITGSNLWLQIQEANWLEWLVATDWPTVTTNWENSLHCTISMQEDVLVRVLTTFDLVNQVVSVLALDAYWIVQ